MKTRYEFPGDAQYVVTAPLVAVRTLAGPYEHKYRGERVPPADPKQISMLLASGMIARIEEN